MGASVSQPPPGRLALFAVPAPDDRVDVHRGDPTSCWTTRTVDPDGDRWAVAIASQTFPWARPEGGARRLRAMSTAQQAVVMVLAEQGEPRLAVPAADELLRRLGDEGLDGTLERAVVELDGTEVELDATHVHGVRVTWHVSEQDAFALAWPEGAVDVDRRIRLVPATEL